MTTAKNTIEITHVSDRVLDIYLSAKANPDIAIETDELSATERGQLSGLMGWANSSYLTQWIGVDEEDNEDWFEKAILERQEHDSMNE